MTSQLPLPLTRSENRVTKLIKRLNATRSSRKNSLEEKASQEEESSEEEGGMNVVTGLLSAFLSGLSRVCMHLIHQSIRNDKLIVTYRLTEA